MGNGYHNNSTKVEDHDLYTITGANQGQFYVKDNELVTTDESYLAELNSIETISLQSSSKAALSLDNHSIMTDNSKLDMLIEYMENFIP